MALPILAHVFEEEGRLDALDAFAGRHGAAFYGLGPNEGSVTLEKDAKAATPPTQDRNRGRAGDSVRSGVSASLASHGKRRGVPMIPTGFPPKDEIARLSAAMLIETGSVNFRPEEPYTLASGLPSPTYVDCRRLIGFPRVRAALMDFLAATVMREAGFEAFTNIAGGETAGIPFAALLADRLALPMSYVRKKPKGYGRNARIEGPMGAGDRVLLVEDLATDGGSKLSFVAAIRETGATCGHTAVIFFYGIFPGVDETLGAEGVRLHALCTWWDVLAAARAAEAFDAATCDAVEGFLRDPRGWQEAQRSTGAGAHA